MMKNIAFALVVVFVLVDNGQGKVSRWWKKPGKSTSSFQNEVLSCLKDIKEDTNILKDEMKKLNKKVGRLVQFESPLEEFKNHTYTFVKASSSWDDAVSACAEFAPGAYLLQIDNLEEWDFIKSIVDKDSSTDMFWTSLNDKTTEGTWVWHDDTEITSEVADALWFSGSDSEKFDEQPNGGTAQNCGELRRMFRRPDSTEYAADTHYMADRPCEDVSYRICEVDLPIGDFYY